MKAFMPQAARLIRSLMAIPVLLILVPAAIARPMGGFGGRCVECHGGPFLDGRILSDALLDVVSDLRTTIPNGAFGDPDRGEGPLATYEAMPGGTFQLLLQIKDPGAEVVDPHEWAAGIKRIYATDPDFQAGDPDPLNWRNDQLTLVGAMAPGNQSTTVPADETGWTLQTDASFYPPLFPDRDQQYYTSADTYGHDWTGEQLLSLEVTVPGGVLPGWYDIEVSVEGLDFDFTGFYDEEHFYLHVIPEPATALLLLVGFLARNRLRGVL